ncbi:MULTISPECIES: peptidylprolyl isomerase [Methanosphaera]|jgi:FKBP-type peptidyl-prolyl cis-trans isomerase 2|uniref:Peptidyl-prolyl cis-trans isomerase n=2 Tax=Methanosphaera stadtmanae TaxID=2317 RepID=Q2NHZ2_METST|nr:MULTISPECIES: peptidylprolyl isomerase [Methanosphaera]ABC56735.1 predicted peptidyl-prolyl cis-trans isomerase 2 [Methanosphaera stadtmanae DSM 3091]MDO5822909.1 peptidylprolyl isomerase [Methanosphaera sp.]MEE0489143.1 peptidylprolyl isomerase [Methanosphaera stadtmanae]OEC89639.1 peptidylprolyl isomerase [Methanosphaera sp. A6]RAP03599.1 peptidylprolyl isomerase [Methanosphaera stadtmanae]
MPIDDKDFVKLNYTGKVKETGDVFDTTYEDVAEEAGIKNENKDYHPMILAVGSTQLLSKLHDEIKKMDVGEKQTVEIPCEEAFGKRDPSLIQLIPMKEFKKQNIKPFVGMPLSLDGQHGIVRTVDGGRVRVDFNHELAGKDIIYEIEIVDTIDDNVEKIKGLIEVYYGNPNIDLEKTEILIEDGVAKITLDKLAGFEQRSAQEITLSKFRVARETYENIDEIEKVQFIDEYEKPEPEEESEDAPEVLDEE